MTFFQLLPRVLPLARSSCPSSWTGFGREMVLEHRRLVDRNDGFEDSAHEFNDYRDNRIRQTGNLAKCAGRLKIVGRGQQDMEQ